MFFHVVDACIGQFNLVITLHLLQLKCFKGPFAFKTKDTSWFRFFSALFFTLAQSVETAIGSPPPSPGSFPRDNLSMERSR